jgi:hypothetical protein
MDSCDCDMCCVDGSLLRHGGLFEESCGELFGAVSCLEDSAILGGSDTPRSGLRITRPTTPW